MAKRPVAKSPLPPIEATIKQVEVLERKRFESKAHVQRASKNSHRVLRYILMHLEAVSKYDVISGRSLFDFCHRLVRTELDLEDPPPCPPQNPIPAPPSSTTDPSTE